MPVFEYECDRGHKFEKLVSSSEPHPETMACDECAADGHMNLADKLVSATPTTFRHNDRHAIKRKGR